MYCLHPTTPHQAWLPGSWRSCQQKRAAVHTNATFGEIHTPPIGTHYDNTVLYALVGSRRAMLEWMQQSLVQQVWTWKEEQETALRLLSKAASQRQRHCQSLPAALTQLLPAWLAMVWSHGQHSHGHGASRWWKLDAWRAQCREVWQAALPVAWPYRVTEQVCDRHDALGVVPLPPR